MVSRRRGRQQATQDDAALAERPPSFPFHHRLRITRSERISAHVRIRDRPRAPRLRRPTGMRPSGGRREPAGLFQIRTAEQPASLGDAGGRGPRRRDRRHRDAAPGDLLGTHPVDQASAYSPVTPTAPRPGRTIMPLVPPAACRAHAVPSQGSSIRNIRAVSRRRRRSTAKLRSGRRQYAPPPRIWGRSSAAKRANMLGCRESRSRFGAFPPVLGEATQGAHAGCAAKRSETDAIGPLRRSITVAHDRSR